jgi:glycosyltransferase involved in cell wall biosynthesis
MPKILRIINRFNLGGPTYNAAYLTRYMTDEYETLLVGGHHTDSEEDSFHITDQLGIQPITIPEMMRDISIKSDGKAFQKIAKLIDWFQPDIVHTHASKAGALGRLAAFRKNVPVVVHTFHGNVFHSYFNRAKTQAYITIERQLAARSSAVVAISPLQKKELTETFRVVKKEKVEVIPLGFDLDKFQSNQDIKRKQFRKKYNIDNDELAIGIIGRLVHIKNHSLFLKVAEKTLNKSNKKLRFMIIGDGDLKDELVNEAKQLKMSVSTHSSIKAEITFTSWIKDIDEAIAGLDIIVMTSKNEGTPVSLIEAQAGNKAIITTDVGGIKDIIIPNESGLVSPSENEVLMTQNLLHIINDENLRMEMGNAGSKFVKNRFTYQRLANDMDLLYQKLLNDV